MKKAGMIDSLACVILEVDAPGLGPADFLGIQYRSIPKDVDLLVRM